jgi:hypothetical protein
MDKWQKVWDKFNKLVLDDFSNEKIDEDEMERRLDQGESTNDPQDLIEYAKEFDYKLK